MRSWKKSIAAGVTALSLLLPASAAFAMNDMMMDEMDMHKMGDMMMDDMMTDDMMMETDGQSMMVDGMQWVRLRDTAETMGFTVSYDAMSKTVMLKKSLGGMSDDMTDPAMSDDMDMMMNEDANMDGMDMHTEMSMTDDMDTKMNNMLEVTWTMGSDSFMLNGETMQLEHMPMVKMGHVYVTQDFVDMYFMQK